MEPISKKLPDKQIQWSDAGDILENIAKGSLSHGADYLLSPLEWASGYDISKDLLGIPEYEDWNQEYREAFEEGDFGALRHLDKLSHVAGFFPALGAYKGITMLPKGVEVAKRYFPSFKYFGDLSRMNKAYKLKQAQDAGTAVGLPATRVARWLQKAKDFSKVGGQTIGRPIRHLFNPKRWSQKFDKYPKTSKPERELVKNLTDKALIIGGTRLGIEGLQYAAKKDAAPPFIKTAGASELPSYSNYQDPIMKMAKPDRPAIGIQFSDGPTYWG